MRRRFLPQLVVLLSVICPAMPAYSQPVALAPQVLLADDFDDPSLADLQAHPMSRMLGPGVGRAVVMMIYVGAIGAFLGRNPGHLLRLPAALGEMDSRRILRCRNLSCDDVDVSVRHRLSPG